MTEHFFTFTGIQTHPETGMPLSHRFVRISASDPETARLQMMQHFGRKWGFQYASAEDAGVQEFGLTELVRDDWPVARSTRPA